MKRRCYGAGTVLFICIKARSRDKNQNKTAATRPLLHTLVNNNLVIFTRELDSGLTHWRRFIVLSSFPDGGKSRDIKTTGNDDTATGKREEGRGREVNNMVRRPKAPKRGGCINFPRRATLQRWRHDWRLPRVAWPRPRLLVHPYYVDVHVLVMPANQRRANGRTISLAGARRTSVANNRQRRLER